MYTSTCKICGNEEPLTFKFPNHDPKRDWHEEYLNPHAYFRLKFSFCVPVLMDNYVCVLRYSFFADTKGKKQNDAFEKIFDEAQLMLKEDTMSKSDLKAEILTANHYMKPDKLIKILVEGTMSMDEYMSVVEKELVKAHKRELDQLDRRCRECAFFATLDINADMSDEGQTTNQYYLIATGIFLSPAFWVSIALPIDAPWLMLISIIAIIVSVVLGLLVFARVRKKPDFHFQDPYHLVFENYPRWQLGALVTLNVLNLIELSRLYFDKNLNAVLSRLSRSDPNLFFLLQRLTSARLTTKISATSAPSASCTWS